MDVACESIAMRSKRVQRREIEPQAPHIPIYRLNAGGAVARSIHGRARHTHPAARLITIVGGAGHVRLRSRIVVG